MDPDGHIAAVRRDGHRIINVAVDSLDRVVPSCPGWNVSDLVWHVGIVHLFWRMVARGELDGPDAWTEPDRPSDGDLVAWFGHGVDVTAEVLEGLAPDAPAWTWGRRKDVGFIRRRVAQETAVHGWDAANAVARNDPIDRMLAVDGIDEFIDDVLPALSHDLGGTAQRVCLRASDGRDEWTVRAGEGAVTRISGRVDAVVTATASDLLLFLWGRRMPDEVAVDGDVAALQRFLARAKF
ncbi:maleylpyruvate isomerase family mycothiol-dependent enzyme [Skermania sp. ID1734]|uniref:maleylpyruvate isomerase family mycothiol-dependent enzyme n=1 Tax=Skermania sp. ID1734 TaxID=2597516 RepID=UPI00117E6F78|nr:maleylpyruvate isomerase family mycothiol-dependent enzyme [Skermania sp. ID1734]TSE01825.1 maleylpyruvate isomerase family mycothiol-dependent enzyme [Skermania sp. ID1734]